MTAFAFSVPGCAAQDEAKKMIDILAHSSKIIESDLVLEEFVEGRQTTRVIVTLLEPERFRKSRESEPSSSRRGRNFKDPVFREELKRAVRDSQEQVIRRLDHGKIRITNRFVYVFGFSKELKKYIKDKKEDLDEVILISKDRLLEIK